MTKDQKKLAEAMKIQTTFRRFAYIIRMYINIEELRRIIYVPKKSNLGLHNREEQRKKTMVILKQNGLKIPLLAFGLYFFDKKSLELERFCLNTYKSVYYALRNIHKPDNKFIQMNKIRLPVKIGKLLLLDLDQTLVYCHPELKNPQVELQNAKATLKFNVRPFCQSFLKKMSEKFDIYVFTSSTAQYANPIVRHLNKDQKLIQGILHREHCLKTKNGLYIKDLRIIGNVPENQMVIVDNKIHSFSFHLHNGIPVQEFKGSLNDQVLNQLQKLLDEAAAAQCIPDFLKSKLRLSKIIQTSCEEFKEEVNKLFQNTPST